MPEERKVLSRPTSVVFPPTRSAKKTICVLGTARGGTSMVAGILQRLGIFMGTELGPETGEDFEFLGHAGIRDIFDNPDLEADKLRYLTRVNATIARRNALHNKWGWKDPIAGHYIEEIDARLRNPHFILVTRDLGAVAQHEMYVERAQHPPADHIINHIYAGTLTYQRMLGYLASHKHPTLLLSYERAMRTPAECVEGIAAFIGVKSGLEEAIEYIGVPGSRPREKPRRPRS